MTAKLADFDFSIELPRLSHGKTMFTLQELKGIILLKSVLVSIVTRVMYIAMV